MRSALPDIRMIWGVGLNYRDHAVETGRPLPEAPTLFVKSRSSLIANGEPIVVPPVVTMPDYEGELAVVIGRRARDVASTTRSTCSRASPSRTTSPRATISTRRASGAGRSRSTRSARSGPEVVSLDEIDLAAGLPIETVVSGEVLQSSNTSELLFSVPQLIAWISQGCTLEPGDVILTGHTGGCRRGAHAAPLAGRR